MTDVQQVVIKKSVIPEGKRDQVKKMLLEAESEDLKNCWNEIQPILEKYGAMLTYQEIYLGGKMVKSDVVVTKRTKPTPT